MKTVLFVDEEAWYIRPLLIYFEARYPNCRHEYAFNGVKAMEVFTPALISCVVLDIMMAYGEDDITERFAGLIILDRMRKISKETPIICYTARDEELIEQTISQQPNTLLISKRDSVDKLWAALDQFIKK